MLAVPFLVGQIASPREIQLVILFDTSNSKKLTEELQGKTKEEKEKYLQAKTEERKKI